MTRKRPLKVQYKTIISYIITRQNKIYFFLITNPFLFLAHFLPLFVNFRDVKILDDPLKLVQELFLGGLEVLLLPDRLHLINDDAHDPPLGTASRNEVVTADREPGNGPLGQLCS